MQNSITNAPGKVAAYQQASTGGSGGGSCTYSAEDFPPIMGLNYLQAMENSPNATQVTFSFNGGETELLFEGEF